MPDIHWVSDPGHEWLAVPHEQVISSGYQPTPWSFLSDGIAYLEGDCDAGGFLRAIGVDLGEVRFEEVYVSEFDRGLPRYPQSSLSGRATGVS